MTRTIAFSWIFPIDAAAGGVERVTRRLMDGLAGRGHTCLFLLHDQATGQFVCDGEVVADLNTFLNRNAVDVLLNQNGYSSALTEALEGTSWQGRYVVCYHNEPFFLRKVFDLRAVIKLVTGAGVRFATRLSWLARLALYPLWQWISTRKIAATQARNYLRADRYVVLSPSFLPQVRQLLRRGDLPKALAIANPLSFDIAPDEAAGFEKNKEVLVVARMNDGEKRISAALAAWRMVERQDPDGWALTIVGDGPDAAELAVAADDMGLRRVTFAGRAAPLPYYRTASIFLMTSRVEGWGLTLTEAMQTGTVPVAFDAYASLRDIVEDDETGVIVANGDVEALANAILGLMRSPDRRAALSARGIEAAQRYRLNRVLDQWEALL